MQNKLGSHALYTDHYEFTMLDALVQSGQVDKSLFLKSLRANFLWEDHLGSLLASIGFCHF